MTKFKQTETRQKNSGHVGEIPEGWELRKLGSLGQVVTGKTPPTIDTDSFGMGYPFITPRDMHRQKYIRVTERCLTEKGKDVVKNCLLPADSVCVSCIGSDMGKVVMTDKPSVTNQQLNSLICDNADPQFVYYGIINIASRLRDTAFHSTAVPILNKSDFSHFEILMPEEKSEQRAIAKILSDLDEKIELNHQMNKTLESIAQAIFKRWFVDFEFPDKNGKPYKSSGGKMINSDVGEIPEKWRVARLGEFFPIKTGKKDANVASDNGKYPFFTCSQQSLLCDEYSFDGSAILLAGNCDFNVKWIKGKFEAYQRTYVLIPHNPQILGFLYYLMQYFLNDITAGHRGSVINFITKGMIEDFLFISPLELELEQLGQIFEKINLQIEHNKQEIQTLTSIRDSLLPRLMSGKIRVA